ncbi:serine/threonine protein kinase [Actinomadura craniellae]|uniref:non-specific serine/threonine protein kinase n=1 Tax=Actinomadura craniellae TaxID=2231787 RepID=A0A365H5U4_9ACTN|nr:serine/threonine-protein kinase [Actinomadura craniellae]RAY14408.1 serine/threonine protein kinase [Actinomadura craniellae]
MGEYEESPHWTRRDPGVTHRDPDVPDPATTRRDGAPPATPLIRLPEPLDRRFQVAGEIPVQGAESDLLLVRDRTDGTEAVVKVYRRGYRADRDVWAKLPELDSPHVVRILETGHAGDRDYEIIEYAPAGNLRELMAGPLGPDEIAALVAQLADGLAALHHAGIVHRDLKPENVLVTAAAPVRLAITDFGLSKVIDQSVVFASSSRTLAYAAPESLSGQVSPARDWWSLGMIVRELATGRPPFHGLSETVVVDQLATRGVDSSDIPDPRLRLLCAGLLTRDPRLRWGAAEVTGWLDGESPAVAAPTRPAPAGPGLPFAGHRYDDRAELARALVERWEDAARYFFARPDGEAWRTLRDWLAALPDDDGRIELVDSHLTAPLPPDVKLLHLVRWLDPTLPPHYLGLPASPADLPGLAALAADSRHPDHRRACLAGRALWEHRLLPVLDPAGGAEADAAWRGRAAAWRDLTARLHGRVPPQVADRLPEAGVPGRDDPPTVLLTLLALAARPDETARALAGAATRAQAAVPEPVPWFDGLANAAGTDPLRLLVVVRAAPEAVLEVEARGRERTAAGLRAAELRRHWDDRERHRLAGGAAATRRAILLSLPILACWLLGGLLVDALFLADGDPGTQAVGGLQRGSGPALGLLLALAVLAWLVQCGAEVALARRQGADYLPKGPWPWLAKLLGAGGRGLGGASQALSGTARQGRRGCGFLLLAAVIPLLVVLLLLTALTPLAGPLWILILIAAPTAHAIGAGIRHHHWRQTHDRARREALGDPEAGSGARAVWTEER